MIEKHCLYCENGLCCSAQSEMAGKDCPMAGHQEMCKFFEEKTSVKSKPKPYQCLKSALVNIGIHVSDKDSKKIFSDFFDNMDNAGYHINIVSDDHDGGMNPLNAKENPKNLRHIDKIWYVGQWVTVFEIAASKDWIVEEVRHPLSIAARKYVSLDKTLSVTFFGNYVYGTIIMNHEPQK